MSPAILGKEELEKRALIMTRPEFIWQTVYPALHGKLHCRGVDPRGEDGRPLSYEARIVQNTGTGRVTVSYRFEDGAAAFGKIYSDELCSLGNQLTRGLWENGFGNGNCHQVSEPLLYLPEYSFLLTRGAPGRTLLESIGKNGDDVLASIRQAARWLVELHRSPIRMGRPESLWDSLKLSSVLHRITKAGARSPHEQERMISMVDRLCEKGKRGPGEYRTVQTHGCYHHEHIFVSNGTVTLIDFDRSAPADPARDLGEFLGMMRHRTMKRTGSVASAEAPTRAFLEEYVSHLPQNLENIAIHWGAFLLLNMFHYLKKSKSEDPELEKRIEFYDKEFDWVMSEAFFENKNQEERMSNEAAGRGNLS